MQQKQGRVKPTLQAKGLPVNADPSLESEADTMGRKALQSKDTDSASGLGMMPFRQPKAQVSPAPSASVQMIPIAPIQLTGGGAKQSVDQQVAHLMTLSPKARARYLRSIVFSSDDGKVTSEGILNVIDISKKITDFKLLGHPARFVLFHWTSALSGFDDIRAIAIRILEAEYNFRAIRQPSGGYLYSLLGFFPDFARADKETHEMKVFSGQWTKDRLRKAWSTLKELPPGSVRNVDELNEHLSGADKIPEPAWARDISGGKSFSILDAKAKKADRMDVENVKHYMPHEAPHEEEESWYDKFKHSDFGRFFGHA